MRLPPRIASRSSSLTSDCPSNPMPALAASGRSSESTTCTAAMPPDVGTIGCGRTPFVICRATSRAALVAAWSRVRVSAYRWTISTRMTPVMTAKENSAVAMRVRRARSDCWAHQRVGQPTSCAANCRARAGAAGTSALGGQAVTRSAHRLQALPAERHVDLAPQVADVDLDDVGVAVVVRIPHVVQDVGLADRIAGAAHEELQQGELPRREFDGRVAAAHDVRG